MIVGLCAAADSYFSSLLSTLSFLSTPLYPLLCRAVSQVRPDVACNDRWTTRYYRDNQLLLEQTKRASVRRIPYTRSSVLIRMEADSAMLQLVAAA